MWPEVGIGIKHLLYAIGSAFILLALGDCMGVTDIAKIINAVKN